MSMKQKIFQSLVVEGKQKTAAQLAAQLGCSPTTVAARVSEIRDEGYVIFSDKSVDSKGRVKYFYRRGNATRQMVRAARVFHKMLNAVA